MAEEKHVVIFGVVRDINCGTISYVDRTAYELEFGPGTLLGVGIGLGDGNKVELSQKGAISRTDPPPDRPRNRWAVRVGHDPADVARSLELERAYQAGKIRFEGRDMITVAEPAPTPTSPAPAPTSEAQPEGDRGGWVWVIVGLAILVGVAVWFFS